MLKGQVGHTDSDKAINAKLEQKVTKVLMLILMKAMLQVSVYMLGG